MNVRSVIDVVLSAVRIVKEYRRGDDIDRVLDEANLEVMAGEVVFLVGASGSGKSTLLQLLGLVDRLYSGDVILDGISCKNLSEKKRNAMLRNKISFVYQFYHLFSEFSVLDNVVIPQIIAGSSYSASAMRAKDILSELELEHRIHNAPHELSGGEQQRVAIARAIAKNPLVILADEPTGSLDPVLGHKAFDIMKRQVKKRGISLLCVTHNYDLIEQSDRCYEMRFGKCIEMKC